MADKANATASASVGFPVFTFVFAVLLVLKVAGQAGASWGLANLSWFWVFSPLIFGFAWVFFWLVVVVGIIAFVSSR